MCRHKNLGCTDLIVLSLRSANRESLDLILFRNSCFCLNRFKAATEALSMYSRPSHVKLCSVMMIMLITDLSRIDADYDRGCGELTKDK